MSDAIECRVRCYMNVVRPTHRIVCNDITIGRYWSDGAITIDEDEPPTAHQYPRMTDETPS